MDYSLENYRIWLKEKNMVVGEEHLTEESFEALERSPEI